MTLVAGVSFNGMPAFVGDLLLSWRLPVEIDLPTQRTSGIFQGVDNDYAAGLSQKLIIVRPYLMIVWAGAQSKIMELVRHLDNILPQRLEDLPGRDIILSALSMCRDGVELVAMICLPDRVEPYCVGTRGFELNDMRVYTLGTGGPEFFKYIMDHPPIPDTVGGSSSMDACGSVLRFAAHAFSQQRSSGHGLDQSWGGGFEVAYPSPSGFRKIDNLLVRTWVVNDRSYDFLCEAFFNKYYGGDLHISWFAQEEKTYVVEAPVRSKVDPPAEEVVHPVWTIDTFLFRSTAQIIDFARFSMNHEDNNDRMVFSKGHLVGWSMDRSYVDARFDQALSILEKGEQFTAWRC